MSNEVAEQLETVHYTEDDDEVSEPLLSHSRKRKLATHKSNASHITKVRHWMLHKPRKL